MSTLEPRAAVKLFIAFASAYFMSSLSRAITAILAPTLTQELNLTAGDLGLLSGGFFLGFAMMQLPLGTWLDRLGPRTVQLRLLCIAVLACLAFAMAQSFVGLLLARVFMGVGVGASLMAALTGYRRWLGAELQLRVNSWMLMAGAMGLIASTLPVQWLMPLYGWRALFVGMAVLVLLCMALIAWWVPPWPISPACSSQPGAVTPAPGYGQVWRHRYFRRMAPMGMFHYGGLVAIQTLWAGPWLVKVCGMSAAQAASGLFWINVCMMLTFMLWGSLNPALARRGITANQLIHAGIPASLLCLAWICWAGADASWWAWAAFLMFSSCVAHAQPAVAMAMPTELAGRALSAFNLMIFLGVFAVQWGVGLLIDAFKASGWSEVDAYRAGMAVFGGVCLLCYLHFCQYKEDGRPAPRVG
jgi:MFS family permease